MVAPHRSDKEQQIEYAQACLDVEKTALGIHSLSMEGDLNPPKPPGPDPLGQLKPKHLPALAKIRGLLSKEDYYEIISSILEEAAPGGPENQ